MFLAVVDYGGCGVRHERKVLVMNKIKANELRPDAQAFDEIRVTTIPRWKDSELSGSEWRISAKVEFLRNGIVKHEWFCGKVEAAATMMGFKFMEAMDNGIGYYASEDDFCDQEGCKEKASVFLKKKADYCREGHKTEPPSRGNYAKLGETPQGAIRQFCERHSRRGDCGLDDSDSNYEKETK